MIRQFLRLNRNYKIILLLVTVLVIYWIYRLDKPGLSNYNSDNWYKLPRYSIPQNVGKDSKGEMECRQILESLFNKPFPKIRPNFLKNPKTGRNLELDCYNDRLKIALEYNGKQHYTAHAFFHDSQHKFNTQVSRDNFKRQRCKERGIVLIEVPYFTKNRRKYIVSELKRYGKL